MFTCSSQGRRVYEPAVWRACTVLRTLRGDGRRASKTFVSYTMPSARDRLLRPRKRV